MAETPLEVLSRAAFLMNSNQKTDQEPSLIYVEGRPEFEPSDSPRMRRNLYNLKLPMKTTYTQTSPDSPVPKTHIEAGPPPLISILNSKEEQMDPMQVSVSLSRPSVITSTKVMGQSVSYVSNQVYNSQRMMSTAGNHRREIVETAMVDPFVEEHFRRSLGSDYKHVIPDTKTVAGSVDEHFAKALGDTWSQINGNNGASTSKQALHSLVSPAN